MNLVRSHAPFFGTLVALTAIATLPVFAGAGTRDVAFTLLSYAVLSSAWNFIGGFGGQFSLGNAAFVGFGAYATAWLLTATSVPAPVAIAIAAAGVIPLAALASFALFRLHGIYLSVGSLAMALAALSWMENWTVTGASQGLNISLERTLPDQTIYLLTLGLAVVSTLVAWFLKHSDFGLCLQAVRDDEEAATSVGVAAFATKTAAFALSATVTSAMGALIALRQMSIEPTSMFGIGWTIKMIVMSVVGGIGTIWGPVLGAFVVYFGIEKQLEAYQDVSTLITGLLLILVVRFLPLGLVDALHRGWSLIVRRSARRTRPQLLEIAPHSVD